MSNYEKNKNKIRQQAIDWLASFSEGKTYYWSEMAEASDYFEKMGRRYGLLQEFRDNGVV